jgi:hypothetical protein
LVDRVPLVFFLTKMAAVASEKTIRSSFPGMMLSCCGFARRLPPPGNRKSGAGRAGFYAGAAERRPPRKGRAPRPWRAPAVPRARGTFLENLGEVAGLQRASGGTRRRAKWAKTYPYVASWGQRDLAKSSRKRSGEWGQNGRPRGPMGGMSFGGSG